MFRGPTPNGLADIADAEVNRPCLLIATKCRELRLVRGEDHWRNGRVRGDFSQSLL